MSEIIEVAKKRYQELSDKYQSLSKYMLELEDIRQEMHALKEILRIHGEEPPDPVPPKSLRNPDTSDEGIPPGLSPGLAGATLYHAAVVLDVTSPAPFLTATNYASVTFVP